MSSKLTMKTMERRHWFDTGVLIMTFESHLVYCSHWKICIRNYCWPFANILIGQKAARYFVSIIINKFYATILSCNCSFVSSYSASQGYMAPCLNTILNIVSKVTPRHQQWRYLNILFQRCLVSSQQTYTWSKSTIVTPSKSVKCSKLTETPELRHRF